MSRFLRKQKLPKAPRQEDLLDGGEEMLVEAMMPNGVGEGANMTTHTQVAVEESLGNPMIQELNQEAKKKAQQFIRRSFQDPMDLDEVSALRAQLQKQTVVTSSQLQSAVQSKLEALKRAADLMDESSVKLNALSNTMRAVNGRIAESNTSISKYPYLGRVHNVRDNVGKVISQVEFFARVPEKVAGLKEVIAKDPTRIRQSFLECLKLESLRIALLKEIHISRSRRLSDMRGRSSSRFRKSGLVTKGGEFSEETGSLIREAVESHLHIVTDLSRLLRRTVWKNIDDMMDVAASAPQDLVAAFEVVEMQQEFCDRQLAQVKARGEDESVARYEAIREECQARIRSGLQLRVMDCFRRVEEHAANIKSGGTEMSLIQQRLTAASELLSTMSLFKLEVAPCVPPHYKIVDTFIEAFEEHFVPLANELCSVETISVMDPKELLQLVDWFEFYQIQMESYGVDLAIHHSVDAFKVLSEDLMNEYLGRIKMQVMQWFTNIKNLPMETIPGEDGLLITTNPEDMFRVLSLQVAVAEEKLPKEKLKDVIMACLQVLRDIQRDTYDAMRTSYKDMDPMVMCATINDSLRMEEKCDKYFGDIIEQMLPEQKAEREMLLAVLEDVEAEYVEIANKATMLLAKSLLQCDLSEMFAAVFSKEWEAGEVVVDAIPVTLADVFPSLEEWLGPFMLGRIVWNVLQAIPESYIAALVRNCNARLDESAGGATASASANQLKRDLVAAGKQAASMAAHAYVVAAEDEETNQPPSNYRFKNELVAAAQVQSDLEVLSDFFYDYQKLIDRYGKIDEQLEPLAHLACVMRSPSFGGAEAPSKALFELYGLLGLRACKTVVAVNPSLGRQEKAEFLKAMQRLYDSKGSEGYGSGMPSLLDEEGEDEKDKEKSSWAWFRGRKG